MRYALLVSYCVGIGVMAGVGTVYYGVELLFAFIDWLVS